MEFLKRVNSAAKTYALDASQLDLLSVPVETFLLKFTLRSLDLSCNSILDLPPEMGMFYRGVFGCVANCRLSVKDGVDGDCHCLVVLYHCTSC